jgi:hypothetical protein
MTARAVQISPPRVSAAQIERVYRPQVSAMASGRPRWMVELLARARAEEDRAVESRYWQAHRTARRRAARRARRRRRPE